MIERYQNQTIKQIWSQENRLQIWTRIEILVAKYWNKMGLIPDQQFAQITKVTPNRQKMVLLEEQSNHEMTAFVQMLASQAGVGGKWIHYGLTSNDVIDTYQNYCLKDSALLVKEELSRILVLLKAKALQEKTTLCVGRTHGVVAEPITLGYKFALWFSELNHHFLQLQSVIKEINYTKILGPTGMSCHFPLTLNQFVATNLKMKAVVVGSQLFGRHHYITFFACLTNLAVSLEKMATEIRNLHRSEINEVSEGFASTQKGSSSMPHKKNPILCENICALARMLRTMHNNFYYSNLLWHERDLTNSATERVVIPDFFHLLMTILDRFSNVLKGLKVNHDQIKDNLKKHQIEVFSHRILLFLLQNTNLSRIEAYHLLQKSSFLAQKNKQSLLTTLKANRILDYISAAQLQECFNLNYFLKNIDPIFNTVFDNS